MGIIMREWHDSGKRKFIIVFLVIWAVQMAAAFYFCTQKQGFHEDEYYTYYSTARTNGFYVEDGQWMDRDVYRNEFVVLSGQGFQYGLVKQVQSWDVHPPVYYWVFHTAASFVPGVFSKWTGLAVNLALWGVNIVLLAYLAYRVSGRDEMMTLLATAFYGLSPAAMSGVVFIRMYEMLTTFVLLCALLHVWAADRMAVGKWKRLPVSRCLVPMAVVTYLGFLTQYYYFIFLFYLGAVFCLWLLWRERKIWNGIRYAICQGTAFVFACLTYPSCLSQMFRGQRGAQATENFFDLSNTVQRLQFFYELLDEYVFGKMLSALLLGVVLLLVTVYRQRSLRRVSARYVSTVGETAERNCKEADAGGKETSVALQRGNGNIQEENAGSGAAYWLLAAAVVGYFLTVSKTALLLGDTSNRSQLPVYGMIVLLLFQGIRQLVRQIVTNGRWSVQTVARWGKYGCAAAVVLCLLIDLAGLAGGKVVFLYPEAEEQVRFAKKQAQEHTPAVYLYAPGAEWCIWAVTEELLAYPKVYFASADDEKALMDAEIQGADALVVYVADGVDQETQTDRILRSNAQVSDDELMFENKYCEVYYFQ